ncbi:DNA polymerase III subunit delta' [Thiohalocapsa marina]|uniref:DNA polymerase III subunit delta' n=1 Tax=Thiohalocapsa marina TaxID=424902 RepID=A0A5M8FNF3_9GAMM|nr:DNA polymerase III subunit delta' [Thiohalocapsa marina]KAA6186327.1 DNA polymerase III subunit delta' [Thiohalocapsa marina]
MARPSRPASQAATAAGPARDATLGPWIDAELPPWFATQWQQLQAARQQGRLGHALLFAGPAGIGKRRFADLFSASLLCAAADAQGMPCGQCAECRLLQAGNHPDLIRLQPDADAKSGEIKAEAVRALCSHQALTANRADRAILQIAPAEAMNAFAANSLLKTLEEPTDSTLLVLISEDWSRLPATILSRCHRLTLSAPAAAEAVAWVAERLQGHTREQIALLLQLAHGAPLRALALAEGDHLQARDAAFDQFRGVAQGRIDPVAAAAAWQRQDAEALLDWLAGWVSDLLRLGQDEAAAYLNNPDKRGMLAPLVAGIEPAALHRYLQQVLRFRALSRSSANKQLLFESLLVHWARLRTLYRTTG